MTSGTTRKIYVFLGLAISAALIWALFRNINFGELWAALRHANYVWIIPNVLLSMLTMYQRAFRWRHMMAPITRVPFEKLLSATCIGFMANNVLPLRLGEFVRAYSLAYQETRVTKSAALATIFVERMVFDLVALLLIFGAVVASSHLALQDDMRTGTIAAIAIALIGLALVLVLALRPERSGRLIAKALFFTPATVQERIRATVVKFSRGLEFMKHMNMLSWVSLHTLVIWLVMGISNYFVVLAFGFDIPVAASYVLLVVVSISILVPSSPGFVGVYHYGAVWTLKQFGVVDEAALSFALVLHAAQFIPITLMGFYFLRKSHLSLKRLEQEATAADNPNQAG